jgi:hypothetical protein
MMDAAGSHIHIEVNIPMPWQTLGSEILVLTHMILPITYD